MSHQLTHRHHNTMSSAAAAKGARAPRSVKLIRRRTMPAISAALPQQQAAKRAKQLLKAQSWSPDLIRDEVWQRKKRMQKHRRSNSLSFDDMDELKACYELGFRFDSPDSIKLSPTFPALELYHVVKKQYDSTTAAAAAGGSPSPASDEATETEPKPCLFMKGEDQKVTKDKIKLWAQVVCCMMMEAMTI